MVVSEFARVTAAHLSQRAGMFACFPFGWRGFSTPPIHWSSPTPLRTASLATDYRSRETFLHFGPQGSLLSICYYHQDLH